MGVLHFFCCDEFPPQHHGRTRRHSPQYHDGRAHPHDHHHGHHLHDHHHPLDHHQGHDLHDRHLHRHDHHHPLDHHQGHDLHDRHLHQHDHNLRLRVPTPRQDCPNSRGNGPPDGCGWSSTGLRNPVDHAYHGNNNVGGMCHGQRILSPHPHHFKRNSGEVCNNAAPENGARGVQPSNVQMHPGLTNPVPNKPNISQQNHVTWADANGGNLNSMTSQWHTGNSHVNWNGPNGTNVVQMGNGNNGKANANVQAATDGEVVSYNITIHKHMKGKGAGGYFNVKKKGIHFEL